jgi:hypothetical protein
MALTGGHRVALDTSQIAAYAPPKGRFSPGTPLQPTDPQPLRAWDFPAGVNTTITPRAYESFSFAELRAFAQVEAVRLAIETRKDQLERMDWQVKTKDGRKPRGDAEDRIRQATRFFDKPDGEHHFATWLRMLAEDLLVIDAPALERRRTRGGKLIGLDVIPGDTLKILVDYEGRTPRAPVPAYQQIIKGTVWNEMTTDEIIYSPRNKRPGHAYGFGPTEQVLVTINTIIQRQQQQLSYFTEGNTPAGFINVPDNWTIDQIKEYKQWLDDTLSGNVAERSKLLLSPSGAGYQALKEPPHKDEFDEWLYRIVCFAFSLPPTPFIRQMNKGTAEADDERAALEGLQPLLKWSKRLLDGVIRDDLGFTDLEFAWITARDIDPAIQSVITDRALRNGTLTINEARALDGLAPVKGGSEPLVYTSSGVMTLEHSLAAHTEAAPAAYETNTELDQ